ncbi:MAG: hypothetical protein PHQ05_10275 [Sterolibacterium sp.]|nr:hypothetical protein [Sterolibacterium sp.]
MKAYAWANGRIDFGRTVPKDALPIASGPAEPLRKHINATARHSHDGKTLLVPGIPESGGGDAAVDALLTYCREIKKRMDFHARNFSLHSKHFVHTWIKVKDSLPDADLVVLVCTPKASEPVWLGYLDGEVWRYIDASPIERGGIKVEGWSDLPLPMEVF